jgi:hypothetical protein
VTPRSSATKIRSVNEAARAAYVMPETGALIKPGRKLGDEYQAADLPVVKQRLYEGGVRLAMVLNEIWPEK